jgi:predicted RNA-binding protein
MNYWMICLPREDMEHCIKKGVFGATRCGPLKNAKKGDKLVCYISKECKIIALGELTSDYYMSDENVFRSEGSFPDRFNFKANLLGRDKEIDIKSTIDDLTFVTNKACWSVFFRLSNRRIPKEDFTHLEKLAK